MIDSLIDIDVKYTSCFIQCTGRGALTDDQTGALMVHMLFERLLLRNRSIIPRYRKVVVPSTHTAENHDFIFSDQGSRSSTSKSLFRSARSGSMLSR